MPLYPYHTLYFCNPTVLICYFQFSRSHEAHDFYRKDEYQIPREYPRMLCGLEKSGANSELVWTSSINFAHPGTLNRRRELS